MRRWLPPPRSAMILRTRCAWDSCSWRATCCCCWAAVPGIGGGEAAGAAPARACWGDTEHEGREVSGALRVSTCQQKPPDNNLHVFVQAAGASLTMRPRAARRLARRLAASARSALSALSSAASTSKSACSCRTPVVTSCGGAVRNRQSRRAVCHCCCCRARQRHLQQAQTMPG